MLNKLKICTPALLTPPCFNLIMTYIETLQQAVGSVKIIGYINNRHLPEWRLLRFTINVTVKLPICNVIRIALTSSHKELIRANRLPFLQCLIYYNSLSSLNQYVISLFVKLSIVSLIALKILAALQTFVLFFLSGSHNEHISPIRLSQF